MKKARKRIMTFVILAVLGLCMLGCEDGPGVRTDPVEGGALADLASTSHATAKEVNEEGSEPHSPKTQFLVSATATFEQATGPGKILPATPETIRKLKLNLRDEKNDRAEERKKAVDERATLLKQIEDLRRSRGILGWAVLGISCAVALAGVIVLWIKTSWKVGLLGVGGWSLIYTAISLGMFYEQHQTAVIAGGVMVGIAVAGIVIISRLIRKDAETNGKVADALIDSIEEPISDTITPKKNAGLKARVANVSDALDARLDAKGLLGKGTE